MSKYIVMVMMVHGINDEGEPLKASRIAALGETESDFNATRDELKERLRDAMEHFGERWCPLDPEHHLGLLAMFSQKGTSIE